MQKDEPDFVARADYACEKFYEAVRSLVLDNAPLPLRLQAALLDVLSPLHVHKLPWPDLHERFGAMTEKITASLTKRPRSRSLSPRTARAIAAEMIDLFAEVVRRRSQ